MRPRSCSTNDSTASRIAESVFDMALGTSDNAELSIDPEVYSRTRSSARLSRTSSSPPVGEIDDCASSQVNALARQRACRPLHHAVTLSRPQVEVNDLTASECL